MNKDDAKSNDTTDGLDKSCNHVILASDDQRLKMLGEIFGNNTSRSIMSLLIENQMTATQISDRLGIS